MKKISIFLILLAILLLSSCSSEKVKQKENLVKDSNKDVQDILTSYTDIKQNWSDKEEAWLELLILNKLGESLKELLTVSIDKIENNISYWTYIDAISSNTYSDFNNLTGMIRKENEEEYNTLKSAIYESYISSLFILLDNNNDSESIADSSEDFEAEEKIPDILLSIEDVRDDSGLIFSILSYPEKYPDILRPYINTYLTSDIVRASDKEKILNALKSGENIEEIPLESGVLIKYLYTPFEEGYNVVFNELYSISVSKSKQFVRIQDKYLPECVLFVVITWEGGKVSEITRNLSW